jgi:MurNAc alpha-1-phosphate uridylyltransferase
MEFALESLVHAGITNLAVNVHAHPDQMRTYLRSRSSPGISIHESDETGVLLGSAGGLRKGLEVLGNESFLSMNGDVVHAIDLKEVCSTHLQLRARSGVWMTLVLAEGAVLGEQTGQYREIQFDAESGLVTGFGDKKTQVPFFTGTAVFEPEALQHLPLGIPAEFVPDVLEPAIRAGKVGFLTSSAPWLDLGSPELWFKAEHRIRDWMRKGSVPGYLQAKLNQSDPSSGGRFELGKNSIRMDDILHEIKDIRNP